MAEILASTADESVRQLADALRSHGVEGVRLAFVLGSGLGAFAERIERARTIEFTAIDGMPHSRVAGHAGRLVVGEIRGVRVVVQQGRVHLYEGRTVHEVTRAVRAFVALGCKGIVLTNAAGGLRRDWPSGSLMRITDHLNLQGVTPLRAHERGSASPYDVEFGAALSLAAREAKVELFEGVYAGLLGPSYETPAEIRALEWIGASAVGMSTVTEALAARAAGARVAGIACITNHAAGISDGPIAHEDVIESGRQMADRFGALLESAVVPLATLVAARSA